MNRAHHVRIRKARGFQAFGLRLVGLGLWTVECVGCPAEFPTCHRHDQAVDVAAAHLQETGIGYLHLHGVSLSPEAAARIRRAVMAYARSLDSCGNPPGRRASSTPPVERERPSGGCGNPTT